MIARRWHGRVPAAKADEYLDYVTQTGIADYRSIPGNLGAWILHRHDGDVVHIETFTLWESEDSIREFAGDDLLKARYYDKDAEYLLEFEPEVLHFQAVGEN
jgi:heme-degrading monooxygenase HmoA